MPAPATVQAAYANTSGAPRSAAAKPAVPRNSTMLPRVTRSRELRIPETRACHQLPADQLIATRVTATPASARERPRTDVSSRVTKLSAVMKATLSRKARATAAGSPRRSPNVPAGRTRGSAGATVAMPAAATIDPHHDADDRPAITSPAPTLSMIGQRRAIAATSTFVDSPTRPGATSQTAMTATGTMATNAHRQPMVPAISAPNPGPTSPLNTHTAVSSAITRGRMALGYALATTP